MRKFWLLLSAPVLLSSCVGGLAGTPAVVAGQAAPISAQERQQGGALQADIVREFGGAYTRTPAPYVETVGQRIAVQSGLAATPGAFDVTTLDSSIDNAFAIPGGYIYITRDLVALMNDEAELAAVLGHEVGHVAARHSETRQRNAQRNSILGALGQVLVGTVAGNTGLGQVLSQGVGTGAQLATLGFSRSQETQADDLAVQYLARGGYDPAALSRALASLAAQTSLQQQLTGQSAKLPAWASTHPDPGARVARAQQEARAVPGATGQRNRDAFLNAIDGMPYGDDPKQGIIQGRTFIHPVERFAFTVPDGFTMQNSPNAVSISGPSAKAQFATARATGDLPGYVRSVLQGLAGEGQTLPAIDIQRTTVNGLPAAYARIRANSGSTPLDVTVFAYQFAPSKIFHFTVLAPAGSGVGALAPTLQSVRAISAAEAGAIKGRFVRVVRVGSGDSVQSLSQRMAYDDAKLERFLVLNGLGRDARVGPGDRVKIVTY